jgi:hypothetical protein
MKVEEDNDGGFYYRAEANDYLRSSENSQKQLINYSQINSPMNNGYDRTGASVSFLPD